MKDSSQNNMNNPHSHSDYYLKIFYFYISASECTYTSHERHIPSRKGQSGIYSRCIIYRLDGCRDLEVQ